MRSSIEEYSREHNGVTITIKWWYDEFIGPPWKEHEGHGPVSDPCRRDKRPSERVLSENRFYDFGEAVKIARRDGWGVGPEKLEEMRATLGREPKRGEIAVASVEADFKYLQRWCQNEWHWCGYTVTGGCGYSPESVGGYSTDDIKQETEDVFKQVSNWLDKEMAEEAEMAARDIKTVG